MGKVTGKEIKMIIMKENGSLINQVGMEYTSGKITINMKASLKIL